MSTGRKPSILRKHGRIGKILALVPIEHAPSDTSDKSDISDNEIQISHPPSIASSPPPSLNSSLERMHLLSSPEPEVQFSDGEENHQPDDQFEAVPLTPIIEEICPSTPTREPNYDNIPSISSIPSLPSITPQSTPRIPITRKTRAERQLAPVAEKQKKAPKLVLTYLWKKVTHFITVL